MKVSGIMESFINNQDFPKEMAETDLIKVKEIGLRLSHTVEELRKRDFLRKLKLGSEPRIKVLVGFRGLGKTTALLQLMHNEGRIYFSLDHPYIIGKGLYELGKSFIKAGYSSLLVDEVHHYKNWKQESKALYDEFPKIEIILSGSAPLAFEPERRYDITPVEQMSLKEMIEIQGQKVDNPGEAWKYLEESLSFLAIHDWVYEYFQHYWQGGGFPIYLAYKEKTLMAIYNSIRKSIWEDAPFFSRLKGEELIVMEKLLISLATSSLGEFSINNLAKQLEIKKHRGYELISLLEKMKILRLVRPYGKGPKAVRGEPKLMFYHPNLRSAVCKALDVVPDKGALREELAVFSLSARGWLVSTIKGKKRSPDYFVKKGEEEIIVEVGGAGKKTRQLKGFKQKTMVLDERQLIALSLF